MTLSLHVTVFESFLGFMERCVIPLIPAASVSVIISQRENGVIFHMVAPFSDGCGLAPYTTRTPVKGQWENYYMQNTDYS